MKYISLGAVAHPSTEHILNVSHCGFEYILTGEQAKLWLDGRFGFANSENPIEHRTVNHLSRMGLVMITNPYGAGEYRALTKCHIVPAEQNNPYVGLNSDEKEVLMWLREAGLRLTIAELVFLRDRNIMPSLDLLGQENRQKLVNQIYTRDNIFDNLLENQMELSKVNSGTVKLVLTLLKKKRIILL